MHRYLITGGAGFIGSHLANSLISERAESVVVVDNLRSGDWSRLHPDVERVEGDISQFEISDWQMLLSNVDVVFHLAAEKYNSSKSTPEKLINTNVLAMDRLGRAASNCDVKRLVFTSSLYAYGSLGPNPMCEGDECLPNTLYGASKLMGEGILRSISKEQKLSWNIARLFFIYGPNQFAEGGYKSVIISNFERMISGEKPIIRGDGKQSLDYVYIDDCVNSLRILADSKTEHQIVNIASGSPVSINELTKQMKDIADFKENPKTEPSDWTNGSSRWGSPAMAEDIFGLKCQTSVFEGLSSVYRWMKSNA